MHDFMAHTVHFLMGAGDGIVGRDFHDSLCNSIKGWWMSGKEEPDHGLGEAGTR
jgi:hypothetical protein